MERRPSCGGVVVLATTFGVVAVAPSIAPALACYLLGGVGGGFMGVAANSMILRSVPDAERPRLLGVIKACRNTTFGLGVVGAGALVGLLGPQPVYAAVGILMALGTIPVAVFVRRLGGFRALRSAVACRHAGRS